MERKMFGCLVLSLIFSFTMQAFSEPVSFSDKVTLKNNNVDVSVSPKVGRIVEFKLKGGRNILKTNNKKDFVSELKRSGYKNYGGDKVYNSQQYDWFFNMNRKTWPPDEYTDGRPWKLIKKTRKKIIIQSEISKYLGTRYTRDIELKDDTSKVTITNTLEQIKPTIFPVMIWTITLVRKPLFSLLDARYEYYTKQKWTDLRIDSCKGAVTSLDANTVKFQPTNLDPKPKIGTMGSFLAAVYSDVIFIQKCQYDVKKCYPDGASLEIFMMSGVCELETLSPQVHMQPGDKITHKVTWELLRPAKASEIIKRGNQ